MKLGVLKVFTWGFPNQILKCLNFYEIIKVSGCSLHVSWPILPVQWHSSETRLWWDNLAFRPVPGIRRNLHEEKLIEKKTQLNGSISTLHWSTIPPHPRAIPVWCISQWWRNASNINDVFTVCVLFCL